MFGRRFQGGGSAPVPRGEPHRRRREARSAQARSRVAPPHHHGPGLHFPACLGAPLRRHFPVCGASAASALTRPSRGRRGVEAVSGRGAPWGGLGGARGSLKGGVWWRVRGFLEGGGDAGKGLWGRLAFEGARPPTLPQQALRGPGR